MDILLALLVTDAARCVPTGTARFIFIWFVFFADAARCVPTWYSVLRMVYCFFIIRKLFFRFAQEVAPARQLK